MPSPLRSPRPVPLPPAGPPVSVAAGRRVWRGPHGGRGGPGGLSGAVGGEKPPLTSPRRGLDGAPGEASPRPVPGLFPARVGRVGHTWLLCHPGRPAAAGASRELPHVDSVALVCSPNLSPTCAALSCPN